MTTSTTIQGRNIFLHPGDRIALLALLERRSQIEHGEQFAPIGRSFIISAGVTGIARVYYPIRSLFHDPYFSQRLESAKLLNNLNLALDFALFWPAFLKSEHYSRTIHIELVANSVNVWRRS